MPHGCRRALRRSAPPALSTPPPEQTLWYRTVQAHLNTWLELASGPCGESPPAHVERSFRRYLECDILAHGFARARCHNCQHEFLIAFPCKGRGVCPACNTRRMVETAAHLVDHVFPRLAVRQWVLAVPKRLRYFLQEDADLPGAVLRIFLDEVERCLCEHSPRGGAAARSGAVAFIHRFGSSLNEYVHFHCCVIDGVFEPAEMDGATEANATPGVVFPAATGLDPEAISAVQAQSRRRILRVFVRRGLIEKCDAEAMTDWEHGGAFSVDAAVRSKGNDRAGLGRLLRYCARPPFALEHLHQSDAEHLVYHCPKPRPDGPRILVLTPLELIDRIAVLVPPLRTHHHRYYGVLAPNAPLRSALTALAPAAAPPAPTSAASDEEPSHRSVTRYLWPMLLARIYEAFPLLCPICHAEIGTIAFINEAPTVKKILEYLGESS